jgi:hypothetical protein
MMKKIIFALGLSLVATSALAQKDCEELRGEISAKLQAKGVKSFTLEIVPNEKVKDEKVVGSCDGGTKKITYKRGLPAANSPAAIDNRKSN